MSCVLVQPLKLISVLTFQQRCKTTFTQVLYVQYHVGFPFHAIFTYTKTCFFKCYLVLLLYFMYILE